MAHAEKSSPVSRILGIDPGTLFTGWGLLAQNGKRSLHSCGELAADSRLSMTERIVVQSHKFSDLLADILPDVVCIEDYVYQGRRSHNANSFWLSRLVGRFEERARATGDIKVILVDKGVCNRAAGLRGKVSARRIRLMLVAVYPNLAGASDHTMDAVLAAIAGAQRA
jgi:hypothetical protein